MKKGAIAAVLGVFLVIPWAVEAQNAKDPSVAGILSQAAVALGGQIETVKTVRAHGTYTRFLADGKTAIYDVQMVAAGPDRVRWDVAGAGNKTKTTTVVAGNNGWIRTGGKKKPLAIDELAGKGFERFPVLLVAAWMNDAKVKLTDMGTAADAGIQYRQLRAMRAIAQAETGNRAELLEQSTQIDCYFDQSGLPVWIRYYENPTKMGQTLAVDLRFSDPRNLAGVVVPMTVTISFDKQSVGVLRFDDIKVNVAVTADDFKE